jgi:hypothetical protein
MLARIAADPERNAANLAKAREAARAWHGSPEGRAWHAENAKRVWTKRQRTPRPCRVCGAQFEAFKKTSAVCSSRCRQAEDNRRGRYRDVPRTCEGCGAGYIGHRYRPTRCCSRGCATRLRVKERKERKCA